MCAPGPTAGPGKKKLAEIRDGQKFITKKKTEILLKSISVDRRGPELWHCFIPVEEKEEPRHAPRVSVILCFFFGPADIKHVLDRCLHDAPFYSICPKRMKFFMICWKYKKYSILQCSSW